MKESKSEMIPTLHLGKWVQFRIAVDGQSQMHNLPVASLMCEKMGHIRVEDWTREWVIFSADIFQATINQKASIPGATAKGFFWCSMDRFLSMWFPKEAEQQIINRLEADFIRELEEEKIAAEQVEQENNRSLNIAEDTGANM